MDGKGSERDDLGEAQIYYRYGQDASPGEDAYADDGRPDNVGSGSPPPGYRRAAGTFGSPSWDSTDAGLSAGHSYPGGSSAASGEQGYPASTAYVPPAPYGQAAYGQGGYGEDQLPRGDSGIGRFGADTYEWGATTERGGHDGGAGAYDQADTDNFRTGFFGREGDPNQAHVPGHRGASLDDDAARESRGDIEPARLNRLARRAELSRDDDEERPARERVRSGRHTMPLWQELPLLLVVAFCLAVLIRTFLLQAFYIPSGSMEQTLLVGDRVLVNKIVYDVRQPERGEVIVFRGTDNWAPENFAEPSGGLPGRVGRTLGDLVGISRPGEKDFIKRVIGVPGDRVSCCDPSGRIYVNGKGIDEPYVLNNSPEEVPSDPRVCRSRRFDEVLVPPGQLFVMGDHRIVSQDSRCQGTVPIENVIGRAFVIVWPSGRWDTLGVPETFASVPGPVAIGPPGPVPAPRGAIGVGAALTLPILASLVVKVRSGRKRRRRPRTLPR